MNLYMEINHTKRFMFSVLATTVVFTQLIGCSSSNITNSESSTIEAPADKLTTDTNSSRKMVCF